MSYLFATLTSTPINTGVANNSIPGDLDTCLKECMEAQYLFLNNKFEESMDKLRLQISDSMYHSLIYATIVEMQAMMTFEHDDIINAGSTMKEAQAVCQRWGREGFRDP
ncbi:Tetratricopeptide repeat protein 39A [Acipenser ruthenus]|uniref:Tetratricopeptide repeat protein 39A n=1 Tax=Acipenser ruthenus TaxID=7906 RepID=A0A444U5S4_ACIRT|nr:Tetratricopeptide repeat protein 39A [Acipenser ruthenus]